MRRTTSTAASQETALERGKVAYNVGNLTVAVTLLKEVVRGCCPNSTVTDGPCTCRDLLRALEENDLRSQLVAKCKCKAKLDKRCRNQGHMDALNLLTLVAMKKSKGKSATATSLAAEMIWRNPRDPSGYLRLGQILRKEQKPAIAFNAYSQGAMLVAEKYPDHPRLEVLRQQADAVEKVMRKVDPIQALPLELINMIFSILDTTEICRCLQVSKTWKAKLESADARDVWLYQSYTLPRTKSRLASKVFHRYIQSYTCGRLRGFTIKDESGFMAKHFPLFSRCCGELQHLTLKGSIDLADRLATTAIPYRLETLYIGNRVQWGTQSIDKFLTYCSKTLRELSLMNLPPFTAASGGIWTPSWPDLPLVETLRLAGGVTTIHLPSFASRTPNVRNLWLSGIILQVQDSDIPESGFWPKVERLYCRTVARSPMDLPAAGMPLLGISEQIAELFLDKAQLDLFFGDTGLYEGSYDGTLANLESLSITNCNGGGPEKLKRIIIPSLENRSLEALQLNPWPLPSQQRAPAAPPAESKENNDPYTWLRNKCVKHLTVGGLNLRHGIIDLDATLTAIVSQCSALTSLDIGQEVIATATVVAFIKKDRGVRALWHNNPELPTYDLQAWVRDKDLGEVHRRPYPGSSEELWKRFYDL
ncbi:F-box/TPR repeat protein pof3 [Apiospora saccharicola]